MTFRKRVIPWMIGPAALLAATTALAQAPANGRGEPDQPTARNGKSNNNGPRQPGSPIVDRRVRGAITPILLIGIGAVQEELKLTDVQKKKIRELNDGFDKKRRESADRLIKAKGEGELDQGALMAMIEDLRRENEEALSRIFDKRQRERVAQISLQLEGLMAVTRPEIATKLNLDEYQLQQIQDLKEQYEANRGELHAAQEERFSLRANAFRPKPDGPRPSAARPRPESEAAVGKAGRASAGAEPKREESEGERMKRESDELGVRFARELNKVLTRRQKTVFNRMLGEPFDLTKVQLRGGQSRSISAVPADGHGELEPIPPDDSRPASSPSKEGRPGRPDSKSGKNPRP
jgi:hypothetical protein